MSTAWFGWCSTRSRIEFTDQPIAQMQRVMSAADRIDPNKASAASMVRLRGIGTKRAQAIIDFREKHRDEPFKTPNDLTKINGIGLGTVRGIASYLSLPE
jgi:competence protein ComEA